MTIGEYIKFLQQFPAEAEITDCFLMTQALEGKKKQAKATMLNPTFVTCGQKFNPLETNPNSKDYPGYSGFGAMLNGKPV